VQLPHAFDLVVLAQRRPRRRRTAFVGAVVGNRNARTDGGEKWRDVRIGIRVMRDQIRVELADEVVRADEAQQTRADQIAEIEKPEAAVPDMNAERSRVLAARKRSRFI
jgi:hypothetical protein